MAVHLSSVLYTLFMVHRFDFEMELKVMSKEVEHTILYDECDHDFVSRHTWYLSKMHNTYYASTTIQGRRVSMHRALLCITDPNIIGEHADRNGLNNTRKNIRPATKSQNQWNRGIGKNSTSGMKGVYFCKKSKKWVAEITVYRKRMKLGLYASKEAAAMIYNTEAQKNFGEFASLNDLDSHQFSSEDLLRSPSIGKTGFKGVTKSNGKFNARIFHQGTRYYLGSFEDAGDAARAFDVKSKELHGDFARLNFP